MNLTGVLDRNPNPGPGITPRGLLSGGYAFLMLFSAGVTASVTVGVWLGIAGAVAVRVFGHTLALLDALP